jgi:hypothetical protein
MESLCQYIYWGFNNSKKCKNNKYKDQVMRSYNRIAKKMSCLDSFFKMSCLLFVMLMPIVRHNTRRCKHRVSLKRYSAEEIREMYVFLNEFVVFR